MERLYPILEGIYDNITLRNQIVPLFRSNPGLGKTSIIYQFAKDKGVNIVEIIASQISPFEVSGICLPDKDTKKMMYYNFDRLTDLKDGDILFFDEILNGNPTVLSACLTLLESRQLISGEPLPNIMIIAAGNPQGCVPLTPQIKERFVWYDLKFDKNFWGKFLENKYKVTSNMVNRFSNLIINETFTDVNFYTPRSIDKALSMIISGVETPYYNGEFKAICSELITNILTEKVVAENGFSLEPNEKIKWIDLIKNLYKNETITK